MKAVQSIRAAMDAYRQELLQREADPNQPSDARTRASRVGAQIDRWKADHSE